MSHVVTIKTEVSDPLAVAVAYGKLGLSEPVTGTAKLFSGEAAGLLIKLPDWAYPAVVNTATGQVRFDDYGGRWGDRSHSRPVPPGIRLRKGQDRGPQARPLRRRAGPPRWLDQTDHQRRTCPMNPKIIEVVVNPQGKLVVTTRGFSGGACRDASKYLEQALGARTSETLTTEFHQTNTTGQDLTQAR